MSVFKLVKAFFVVDTRIYTEIGSGVDLDFGYMGQGDKHEFITRIQGALLTWILTATWLRLELCRNMKSNHNEYVSIVYIIIRVLVLFTGAVK